MSKNAAPHTSFCLCVQTFVGNCVSPILTKPLDPTTADLSALALSMRQAIQNATDTVCMEHAWVWEVGCLWVDCNVFEFDCNCTWGGIIPSARWGDSRNHAHVMLLLGCLVLQQNTQHKLPCCTSKLNHYTCLVGWWYIQRGVDRQSGQHHVSPYCKCCCVSFRKHVVMIWHTYACTYICLHKHMLAHACGNWTCVEWLFQSMCLVHTVSKHQVP